MDWHLQIKKVESKLNLIFLEVEMPKMPTVVDGATVRMFSVGEVAERSGVAVSTLHFYESRGLISSIRTAGNQRRYTPGVLRYIAIIKIAQRAGIPLDEIQGALGDYDPMVRVTAAQWKSMATRWRAGLEERIAQLQRLRNELAGCIGCGCLSLKACPLRNPDDKLAALGPGPHFEDS